MRPWTSSAGPAHHDAPALHHVDAVGDVERLANVLLDQQDAGRSLARDPPHRLEQALHHDRREAERQLVDEEQLGIARDGARQRQHLLLPARQQTRGPAHERVELREEVDGVGSGDARDAEVLLGGERHEDGALFGDEAHPLTGPPEQRRLRDRAAEHDLAGDRGELAGERQQRGRLPRAVRSDERHDLTGLDVEIDVAHHRDRAVAGGEATALEQRA